MLSMMWLRCNGDDEVGPLKFVDDLIHVVVLDAFCGVMTGAAAFAEAETIIINANVSDSMFFSQAFRDDFYNFRSCAASHRTAVYHQSIHQFPSICQTS